MNCVVRHEGREGNGGGYAVRAHHAEPTREAGAPGYYASFANRS